MFDRKTLQGGYFALAAYCIWGIAPIYFKLVGHVQPLEIIAHRVTWSAILLMAVLALSGKLTELRLPIKSLGLLLLSATLLACNWLIFVFAVLNDQIIDTSLGYFINPLISVFLGIFFLGERLRPKQWLALSIAFLGVMIQLVVLGHLPLISLALAFSFGFYGLIRKKLNLPAVSGLALETLIILPFALGYLAWQQAQGALAFSNLSLETDLLLVLGGVVTSLPLLFFASAVTRLSLTTVGIFQYLAPSLTLLLAVFYFEEPFNSVQFATFFCVWVSIVIFTTESLGYHRKQYRDHARATDKAP
ncbi:MAG: EamA family transporter RarD [Pseudomonadales bacterium]|jgi:chloramphenicol-sensitive protein RarD|tara:strand:+ start:1252 stop:2163 length:912 start_codon:yes stop_codon:yes gene_type:complete